MLKNIQRVFCATIMVYISLFIFNSGYAEEVDLPCCVERECPTTFESPGMPGVIQTATFKGVRMGSLGELITVFAGDPGYRDWQRSVLKKPQEIRDKLREIARTHIQIFVQCSSSTMASALERGKTIACPEGDGIIFKQDDPTCEDPATGPHSVVEITKVSREENERELAELRKKMEDLQAYVNELDAEKQRNLEQMKKNDQELERLWQELKIGHKSSDFQETIIPSAANEILVGGIATF